MKPLKTYFEEVIGTPVHPTAVEEAELEQLPLFVRNDYQLFHVNLFNTKLVLAQQQTGDAHTTAQIENHLSLIQKTLGTKTALVSPDMTAINRRRLIEKRINFIVPGKQLFLPDLAIDLREAFARHEKIGPQKQLLPSAQFILLYYLQNPFKKLEDLPFKNLAEKFGYSPMTITQAAENLQSFDLCKVAGTKEKFLHFDPQRNGLWHDAQPYLVDPVLKRIFVDSKPAQAVLLSSYSALPVYTDMNPPKQRYYAIDKNAYFDLQKKGSLINENPTEGKYCLEVWKYDPVKLAGDADIAEEDCVDPLSLYLSLRNVQDERIEMAMDAMDKIIDKYPW